MEQIRIMFYMLISFVLSLSLAWVSDSPASQSDVLAKLYEGKKINANVAKTSSGKVMFFIDGKPTALFWANLTEGNRQYKRAGMNTVFAELYYPEKKSEINDVLRKFDQLLLRIKERGLYVIIYTHNTVHERAGDEPWDMGDKWESFISEVVKRYSGVTNLIGWNFSDENGDHITYPRSMFQDYLRKEYSTISKLNSVWKTKYVSFKDINLEYKNSGYGRPDSGMISVNFPYGLGPKAFDSASFKLWRVRSAHKRFEEVIRKHDKNTPIFGGANNLAWPVTQIPSKWVTYFDFYPGFSGPDLQTHHIWILDIGRGPNIRPAIQMFLPEHSANFDWHLDARVIRGWMVESAIHGASGITFWPWRFLAEEERKGDKSTPIQRIDMTGMTIRALKESGIFEMLPDPSIAVLYEPYAHGWGSASQVYGLLPQPYNEPWIFMSELRFGTSYGQVEYLTNDSLKNADLDRYGVIIAPFAVGIDVAAIKKLSEYVSKGGILFADTGFSSITGGKTLTSMHNKAKDLFGIRKLKKSRNKKGLYRVTKYFKEIFGELEGVKGETDRYREMTLDVETTSARAVLKGPQEQGMYVNKYGKGYAIFLSALGYMEPTVFDELLRYMHQNLFSRRALIELVDKPDWKKVSARPFYSPDFEIAKYKNGFAVQNLTENQREVLIKGCGDECSFRLEGKSVLLVNRGEIIPLGSGIWN